MCNMCIIEVLTMSCSMFAQDTASLQTGFSSDGERISVLNLKLLHCNCPPTQVSAFCLDVNRLCLIDILTLLTALWHLSGRYHLPCYIPHGWLFQTGTVHVGSLSNSHGLIGHLIEVTVNIIIDICEFPPMMFGDFMQSNSKNSSTSHPAMQRSNQTDKRKANE